MTVSLLLLGFGTAIALILYALQQNIDVFMSPSDVISHHPSTQYHFRLGGMVKPGSIKRDTDRLSLTFTVTDFKAECQVHYSGVLPDLFREGKGVITTGHMQADGSFIAKEVLAKHDENYMPRSVEKTFNSPSKRSEALA